MSDSEKKLIIQRLKSKSPKRKIYHNDVPDEYMEDFDIIITERKVGTRTVKNIGYDVINNNFFVNEGVLNYNHISEKIYTENESCTFEDFKSFYDYLEGNIYENACYYQMDFSNINLNLDYEKLKEKQALINYTIDDFDSSPTKEEIASYDEIEERKPLIKQWIEKFNRCESFDSLKEVANTYEASDLKTIHKLDIEFFLWNYVFYDLCK